MMLLDQIVVDWPSSAQFSRFPIFRTNLRFLLCGVLIFPERFSGDVRYFWKEYAVFNDIEN